MESFKNFLDDDGVGLVLPVSGYAVNYEDWLEYQSLTVDKSVESINPCDLPSDFCCEACRLVDEFHRKTFNENVEWMMYFDYRTGEVIYCWRGKNGRVDGNFNKFHLCERNIASIHNHQKGYYSCPSPENFDIMKL